MTFTDKRNAFIFINFSRVRRDPDFVERIQRHIGRTECIKGLGINFLPKDLAVLAFGIHERGRYLFEDVILTEKISPHLGQTKCIGNNSVLFIR